MTITDNYEPAYSGKILRCLVPVWVTRRSIVAILVAGSALVLALQILAVVRARGFAASARFTGWLVGIGIALYALNRLALLVRTTIAGSSAGFRSFAASAWRGVEFIAAMSLGAYLHHRWAVGSDITPALVVIALSLLVSLFRREDA